MDKGAQKQLWKLHLEKMMGLMKDVFDAMKNGKTFMDSLGISADEMDAAYALGYQFYKQQKYEKAMTIFEGLYILNPTHKDYLQAIAATLKATGNIAEAGIQYLTAYLFHPGELGLALMACRCMIDSGSELQAYFILSSILDLRRFSNNPADQIIIKQCTVLLEGLEKRVDAELKKQSASTAAITAETKEED